MMTTFFFAFQEAAQRIIDVLIGAQQILPPLANLIKVMITTTTMYN